MQRRIRWRQGCGLAYHLHGDLTSANLIRENSQQMQRISVVGFLGEDLPVDRLRLRQPPGLVVLEGKGKSFRNGHAGGVEHCFAHHARHISR